MQNIDKQIKKAIRETELLESKYDSFNLHKKIKEAAGLWNAKKIGCITQSGRNVGGCGTIKNWVEEISEDDRRGNKFNNICNIGPSIMIEEVKTTIKGVKEEKTAGLDNVYDSELFIVMNV